MSTTEVEFVPESPMTGASSPRFNIHPNISVISIQKLINCVFHYLGGLFDIVNDATTLGFGPKVHEVRVDLVEVDCLLSRQTETTARNRWPGSTLRTLASCSRLMLALPAGSARPLAENLAHPPLRSRCLNPQSALPSTPLLESTPPSAP